MSTSGVNVCEEHPNIAEDSPCGCWRVGCVWCQKSKYGLCPTHRLQLATDPGLTFVPATLAVELL